MTPLSTGAATFTPATAEAAEEFRGFVSESEALASAYAGCPDGQPMVVRDPAGVPAGYYPACAGTGVFYGNVRGALEELVEQITTEWIEALWP